MGPCGNAQSLVAWFTRPGQTHSCGSFSVDQFLADNSKEASDLYRQVEKFILGLGDVGIAPAKARIGFQHRHIFAVVNRAADRHPDIHIVPFTPIQSERVRRIEILTPSGSSSAGIAGLPRWVHAPGDNSNLPRQHRA